MNNQLDRSVFCKKQNKIIDLCKMAKFFLKNLKYQYQKYEQANICCICGSKNCEQAIDHEKLNLQQLNDTINETLCQKDKIEEIKRTVGQYYKEIKISIINLIQKDEYELMTHINKFYFSEQISQNSKIDINMICELMEKNVQRLPSKKIVKVLNLLQSRSKDVENSQLQTLKQQSQRFIENINISTILSTIKPILPFSHFHDELPQLKLKSRTSLSQLINPQQTYMIDQNKIYEWRNVRVTKNSRTVSLSNKNISDKEVMQQIPILANYKNLKQLQIRNNKISCFSCHLIANNMPFLHSIDIRGNRITDKGIVKLINRIPNLKSFSISETQATDETGNQVVNKLHLLEVFWSEHTQITNQVALKIAQKPKLKVLSLLGNPIDDQYKEKMKKMFISKGYIVI